MTAFIKKECMELTRTGRLLILGIIFIFFGILNPAIAKLTPWLYELLQDQIADSGLNIGEVSVTAMTSWTQFYKNAPMVLIVLVLLTSSVLTGEYQKGTLIQVVTKGLSRKKIFFSKLLTVYGTWTLLYLVYTGITLGYTMYFWGGDEVSYLPLGIVMYWLFGMFLMSALMLFGTVCDNSGQVLLGTGAVFFSSILLGYIPKLQKFLPSKLMEGLSLSNGTAVPADFTTAIIIAFLLIIICDILGVVIFDRRKL